MKWRSVGKVLTIERQIGDDPELLERVVSEVRGKFETTVRVTYARIPPAYRKGVKITFWTADQATKAEKWVKKHFKL